MHNGGFVTGGLCWVLDTCGPIKSIKMRLKGDVSAEASLKFM